MKKVILFLSVVFFILGSSYGQNKISSALNSATQSAQPNEKLKIIVSLNERYDIADFERRTRFLSNNLCATLAVEELRNFSEYSQKGLVQFLHDAGESVSDIHPYWIFNGVSCQATPEIIDALAKRADVSLVDLDDEIESMPFAWQEAEIDRAVVGQWGISHIHADQVWENLNYTGNGVVVAIIDSGVNYSHVGLANSLWNGTSLYPNHGYNFYMGTKNPMDDFGRGTIVAGLVAGHANFKTGIAPGASIMALKITDNKGNGACYSSIAQAFEFAVSPTQLGTSYGADIIVITSCEAGSAQNVFYRQMMENLNGTHKVVITSAGDNGQSAEPPYSISSPSNCPSPWHNPDELIDGGRSANICVGATDKMDVKLPFSSIGPVTWANYSATVNDYPYTPGSATAVGHIRPDVTAPGFEITSLSYYQNNGYITPTNGSTAYSAAHVAGVAALLLEANPNLTPSDIDRLIETSAVKCEGMVMKNNYYGAGRVDAYEAVNALLSTVAPPTNLTATANVRQISLNWTPAQNAVSYDIYCNEELLASGVSGSSYTYQTPRGGMHIYYLKSNAANHSQSPKSNFASVFVTPDGPVVTNLSATLNGRQVTLNWDEPIVKTQLRYSEAETPGGGLGNDDAQTYWAQRFQSSMLVDYMGTEIDTVSIYIRTAGTYQFSIYNGNANGPDELLFDKSSFTVSGDQVPGWYHIALDNPILMPVETDLWFVAHAGASVFRPAAWDNALQTPSNFASLLSTDGRNWYNYSSNLSWLMKAHLSGFEYSYNVIRSGLVLASDLTTLSYVDSNVPDGSHLYTVTTNYNNHQNVSNPCDPVTVNINMRFTVSFDAGSGSCSSSQITQTSPNAAITLPSATASSACQNMGYVFAGWSTVDIEGETEEPELLLSGSSFVPQSNLTLYAVYKNVQGGGWNQARTISNGDVLCLVSDDYHVEFNGVDYINNYFFTGNAGLSHSFSGSPAGLHMFTLMTNDGVRWVLKDSDGKYLRKSSDSGSISLSTSTNADRWWTIEVINGNVIMRNSSHDSDHQLVARYYPDPSPSLRKTVFVCVPYSEVSDSNVKPIQFYRKAEVSFISYDHAPSCNDMLFPPTITPVGEGLHLDPVTVVMTTPAQNAQIYYTLDGSDPTSNSLLYAPSNPPVVNSTTTVKARVFKDGVSSAVSQQTYTFPMEYANIAAFKAAANASQTVRIVSDMRITQQDGHYAYVSDESAGLLLYDDYGFVTETLVDGDYVEPLQGRYAMVDGQPMMVLWHSIDKTGENSPVDPDPTAMHEVNTNYTPYESQLVKFAGVHFVDTLKSFNDTLALYVTQNQDTILAVNHFNGVNCTVDYNYTYDVLGIMGLNEGEKNLYLRSNRDIRRYYSITCNAIGEGDLSVNGGEASEYSMVTVNAVPTPGYHVESIYYYSDNPNVTTDIDPVSLQFEMPGADITVVAVFAMDMLYQVSFNAGNGSCDVTVMPESSWHSGVTLPVAAPSSACASLGYTFAGWAESYVNETMITPTLYAAGSVYYPTEDVTLYAVYVSEGNPEWLDVTDANQVIEGNYVITTLYSNNYYYLPHEGVKVTPKATQTTINQGVPAASSALWSIKRISDGATPQYSISYTQNDTTYYLKAKADANNAIQVSVHDPGTGWVFSNHSTKGLMASFPHPVLDPSKSTRYLGLYFKGPLLSTWYFMTESLYQGSLHLFMTPSNTYCTEPVCVAPMEDPVFVDLPEGLITDDSYLVTITHPDAMASIYYTVDGSEPTSASTLYTEPFSITDDCTVKAIAIDAEGRLSNIISHDFDFVIRIDNILTFKTTYNATSSEVVKIMSPVTVAYHSDPYLFVSDETASLMIKDNNHVIANTYTNGMTINGLCGRMMVVNGQKMMVPAEDFGPGIEGSPVEPLEIDVADLASYDAVLVTVKDVMIEQDYDFSSDDTHYTFSLGDNVFYVSDLFDHLTLSGQEGDYFDLTGFVGTNTSIGYNKMLYPTTDNDMIRYYSVVCDTTLEGTQISADFTHAKPGTEVTVTVDPMEGYTLGSLIVKDCNDQLIEATESGFVMPDCDVFVTAELVLINYAVVWTAYPWEGVGVVEIEEESPYHFGDTVHVHAVPSAGFEFGEWLVDNHTTGNHDASTYFVIAGDLNLTAVFNESAIVEQSQTVTLSPGWNWFSSYIEYPDNALIQVEESIAATSATGIIKSRTAFNSLAEDNWTGTLTSLINEEMYLISSEGGSFTLTGTLVDPTAHPITLENGWTWISFLSKDPMDLSDALSSLTPSENDVIKNQVFFSSYSAEQGWTGSLVTMTPGDGYMYMHSDLEATTLVYPVSAKGAVEPYRSHKHWSSHGCHHATNLCMMVTLDAQTFVMGEGSHEIGAFVNGECRGSALLQRAGDLYIAFLVVSGEEGEEVAFRLFDVNRNEEYAGFADEHISYAADDVYGTLKNPMILHFRNTGLNEYTEVNLFPNPTKDKVMIQGQGMEKVSVYNTMGQLLYTQTCDSAEYVELNLGSFSTGVYTVNVRFANGQHTNRMIVKE